MEFHPDNISFDSSCSGNFSLQNLTTLLLTHDCLRYSLPFSVFLIILFLFVFFHGIVGNSVVIYGLIRRARMWSETNMFILNLAASDITVIAFCVPATLLGSLFKPWILGDFSCKLTAYAQDVSMFVSAYSLAAISIDRYIAVRNQANPTVGLTNLQTKNGILLIWIVALFSTFPGALQHKILFSEVDQLNFCKDTWNKQLDNMIYFIFANVLARFFIPFLTIVFTIIGIARTIHTYILPEHWSPEFQELRKRKRINILKLVVGLSSAFFICWLPFHAVMFIEKATRSFQQYKRSTQISTVVPLVHLLGFLNTCISPLLYGLLDENFKISLFSISGSSPTQLRREARIRYGRRREVEGRFQEVVEIQDPQPNAAI